MSATAIVAYLALFTLLGFGFLFGNLLLGKFLRPHAPNTEKLEVYECGEPTIGSSFVQFDLRFYVVALLFIIFDVEVAFFFPWAVVFGKSTQLMDPNFQPVATVTTPGNPPKHELQLTPGATNTLMALGVPQPRLPRPERDEAENINQVRSTAQLLAKTSIADILVFFAVLMVGFAYVWMRGDLDWVRAVSRERAGGSPLSPTSPTLLEEEEPALAG